ncbi:MAG: BTAD domain-containing putative transcriptional regulator [Pseudonocardiaceae bacterium]
MKPGGASAPGAVPGTNTLRIQLLGPVTVLADGVPVPVGGPGVRALLALLALNANHVVGQSEIVDALWAHDPPATARTIVHGHVSQLRRALATAADMLTARGRADDMVHIRTVSPGYQLIVDEELVDVHQARLLLERSEGAPALRRSELLTDALALWRGSMLAGVGGLVRAPELADLRLAIHGARIDADLERGRHAEVIHELGALVRENPLSERFAGQLMRALYHAGRRADALDAYHGFSRRLVRRLGIDPGPELRELHDQILHDALAPGDACGVAVPHAPVVPLQLPPAVPRLAGRGDELTWLDGLLAEAATDRSVVGVVTGAAGIGKSTLVVSWAHRAAERFTGGVLLAALRGFDPALPPREPTEVLAQLLQGLGVVAADLPDTMEERVGLYRSLLAGRKVLVLLDDARTGEQVRPLLPPSGGSMALVTSRFRLEGLVVSSAARLLALDILTETDAIGLISELASADADVAAGATRLAHLCGYLPLALRIVGARLAAAPAGTVHEVVEALADERTRLSALELESLADDGSPHGVRAALDVSCAGLAPAEAATFRLLGTFPGGTVRPPPVAALCGIGIDEARRRLRTLAAHNLLIESVTDVFTAHDLVRLYQVERAAELTQNERDAALTRVLRYYLAASDIGRRTILRVVDELDFRSLVPPALLPTPADYGGALNWFATEWANIRMLLSTADAAGRHDEVWQLARLAHTYRVNRPMWDDWLSLVEQGLKAAERTGDPRALLWMLTSRVAVRLVFERPEGLLADAEAALAIAEEIGERRLVVPARIHLGCALTLAGRHDEAIACQLRARLESERLGDEGLRVQALHNYAEAQKRAGRYHEAIESQRQTLEVDVATGNDGYVVRSLVNLAEMCLATGALEEAERAARRTVELSVSCAFTLQEGVGRLILGRILRAKGDLAAARAELATSLELHRRAGGARVEEIRAEMRQVAKDSEQRGTGPGLADS